LFKYRFIKCNLRIPHENSKKTPVTNTMLPELVYANKLEFTSLDSFSLSASEEPESWL